MITINQYEMVFGCNYVIFAANVSQPVWTRYIFLQATKFMIFCCNIFEQLKQLLYQKYLHTSRSQLSLAECHLSDAYNNAVVLYCSPRFDNLQMPASCLSKTTNFQTFSQHFIRKILQQQVSARGIKNIAVLNMAENSRLMK